MGQDIKDDGESENVEALFSLVWLVATLFLEEPPVSLAEQAVQGDFGLSAPLGSNRKLIQGLDALQEFARAQAGRDASDLHDELRREFAALFIGPHPRAVHPYESVYRDRLTVSGQTWQGLLMGESVDRVRAFWREAGVQSIHPCNYSPDHFGLELGFVAYLGRVFLETGQDHTLDMIGRFLHEHVLAWGPQFCADLQAMDTARFYKPVAQLADGLMATLAQQFKGNYRLQQEDWEAMI